MSYYKRAVVFACLVAGLFISCPGSNPSWPEIIEIVAGPTVTDEDGNVYTSVVIGSQVWTIENWRSTKYNDGSEIPHVTDADAWGGLTSPAHCFYTNSTDAAYQEKWGALYNWYVVDSANEKQIAPAGWRVPTDTDWTILSEYLGGENVAGSKMKETGTANWPSPNFGATNESNFLALPAGYRDHNGSFSGQRNSGSWWTATEYEFRYAWMRNIGPEYKGLNRSGDRKSCGFSLRLVQDLD